MEPTINKIETIEELIDIATPDNIYVLMADLLYFLRLHMEAGTVGVPQGVEIGTVFQWVDDNQHGMRNINVTLKGEENAPVQ